MPDLTDRDRLIHAGYDYAMSRGATLVALRKITDLLDDATDAIEIGAEKLPLRRIEQSRRELLRQIARLEREINT